MNQTHGCRRLSARPRAWVLLLLCTLGAQRGTQEASVPMELQVSFFSRILEFDRVLMGSAPDSVVVGVLYRGDHGPSVVARSEFMDAARSMDIRDRPVAVSAIEYAAPTALAERLRRRGVDVLYVTPLREGDVDPLPGVTRRLRILTLAGVAEYVSGGMSLGLDAREGRLRILVNLEAARAEGADFTSEFLNLARVVKEGT